MGLVVAMGLRAMGIADSIVNLAFGLTLGAVAVAFALAFGLGGRQPAERVLTDLIDKAKREGKEPNPLKKDTDIMTSAFGSGSATSATEPATTTGASIVPTPGQNDDNAPMRTDLSNSTPASLTTAPQDDEASGIDQVTPDIDQAVPDSLNVDPTHPPANNPFGSTGEDEPNVDSRPKKDDLN
jgi:hypothetical protein